MGRVARVSPIGVYGERATEVVQHCRSATVAPAGARPSDRGGSPWASPIPPRQLEMGAGKVVRSMHLLRITAVFSQICG